MPLPKPNQVSSLIGRPINALNFPASYTEGFRAPSLTELEQLVTTRVRSVSDPQFHGERYDVTMQRGGNPNVTAEDSQTSKSAQPFRCRSSTDSSSAR